MNRTASGVFLVASLLGCGCSPGGDESVLFSSEASSGSTLGDEGSSSGASASGGGGSSSSGTDETSQGSEASGGDSGASGGTGPLLDVGGSGGSGGVDGGPDLGCEKADFLFVIDNSGSMMDEQQQLVDSFPGFITTIQQELNAQDYHIMVVDTDEAPGFGASLSCTNGVCTCEPEPQCCLGMCQGTPFGPPPETCAGQPCDSYVIPTGCPVELGAGRAEDSLYEDCGFSSGARYITDDQSDLNGTFACAALVGAGGDGDERPMAAMENAVGPLNLAGECNEGFLRDDAILVVTFITDEAEEGSPGTPASWKQALVDAKNGDEEAIVVLGIHGGGGCEEPAPKLLEFASSFPHGLSESVCAADYSPFFQDAVAEIDLACDNFVPPD